MSIAYCRQWPRSQKPPLEFWTEERARKAHSAGKLYTALIDDPIRPHCFVEVTGESMAVEFLDDHLRSSICYHFGTKRPDRLFITMAIYRCFDGDSEKPARGAIYYYGEDGSVTVHKWVDNDDWEAKTTLDVSANWEPYPAFGQYESITRLDRGLPRIDDL